MSRFIITFFSMVTALVFGASTASSCISVAMMGGPPNQATLNKVDIAFVGQVIKTKPVFQRSKDITQVTTFKITKIWKSSSRYRATGFWSRKIKVYHSTDSGWCGRKFEKGKEYIVLAKKVKGKLQTDAHRAQLYWK